MAPVVFRIFDSCVGDDCRLIAQALCSDKPASHALVAQLPGSASHVQYCVGPGAWARHALMSWEGATTSVEVRACDIELHFARHSTNAFILAGSRLEGLGR